MGSFARFRSRVRRTSGGTGAAAGCLRDRSPEDVPPPLVGQQFARSTRQFFEAAGSITAGTREAELHHQVEQAAGMQVGLLEWRGANSVSTARQRASVSRAPRSAKYSKPSTPILMKPTGRSIQAVAAGSNRRGSPSRPPCCRRATAAASRALRRRDRRSGSSMCRPGRSPTARPDHGDRASGAVAADVLLQQAAHPRVGLEGVDRGAARRDAGQQQRAYQPMLRADVEHQRRPGSSSSPVARKS
jgi:hypothetical protein